MFRNDKWEYHRGYLPKDKEKIHIILVDGKPTVRLHPDSVQLDKTAKYLLYLSSIGKCLLFQKRHGYFDYSYIMVKT